MQNPSVQQASFSPTAAVLILSYIAKASTGKTRLLLHKLASLLRSSVSSFQFTSGTWPSTGRSVVGASHSEESGCTSVKFA